MDTFFQFYDVEPDSKPANWVVERCIGPKHTLHTVIPSGFASYVRICHPAWSIESLDPNDKKAWKELYAGWIDAEKLTPIRWHEVAAANNCPTRRLMQWFQICLSATREPGSAGIYPPLEGELTTEIMETLFEILASHSGANQEVVCGFWEGYNFSHYRQARAKFESYHGQQSYLLFNSTLSRVRDGWAAAYEHAIRHHKIETAGLVPNAIWPTTRDWYLASPYYLPSSYFGGPTDLVNKVCRNETLETYTALPGDDIFNVDTKQGLSHR